ncbi:retention module-containing protein [Pseudomonas mendocina]|uniref:retention module-containing protein n=1 Tax=Ectopseudomonas mendocina TaxID=300 RepID=UPI0023DCC957|nr:retention module-containing protein [Pseudomonas mendocina]MDF2075175.1 retention module-containing protein [Pseudomonas mendocina]
MSSVIATVQSIVGQVFAVSADGARRLLVEGDRLFKGEEILTGDSGMVTLKLADGRTLDLGRDSQWSESDARLAAQDAQAAQQVVSPGDEVAQLQQAIEAGMDPTQTLEATAAGPSAAGGGSGGAGGGHSFVMLDATGEVLEATVGFETSGLGDFAGADEQIQEALPNQAPEFLDGNGAPQGPLSLQTAEDTPISGAFNTRDVNGDLVTLTVTRAPTNGTLVLNANGTWTYTPSQDYNGTDSFEVTASDGRGASTPLTVNLTITPVNDAPVATGTYDATIDDSAAADTFADIKGQLTATDVDDTVLTWSGSATGAYGELTVNPDGSYTYVVDAKAVNGLQEGEQASDSFVVTVRDPSGASDTRVITINFNGANDTPIATASSAAVTEDQSINGTLQASDADKGAVLSYSLTGNAPAGFVLNAQTGEWSLDAGNAAYQYLAEGQKLTLTVPFEVSDQLGAKTSSTLTITVTGVNDAAVLGSANVQLTETDAPLSTGGTLAISDVDSPNTFVAQSNVAGTYGTFNIDAAGNWTYLANSAFNELNVGQSYSESFKVTSADGTETSVTVTINGTNDAAVLSSANVQLTETDAPLTANGTLTISDVDSPATFVTQSGVAGQYGTFSIDAAGNWSFVAHSAYNELNVGQAYSESFEVESADGTKTSVTVTINGSNDRPVGVADHVTLDEDTTATGNVLSNDTDVDNTSLTVTKFSLTNLPFVSFNAGATADLAIGKLTIQANGDFTFVPAKDYNGPVPSITYTLSDGSATSTATLTFDIKPVNDAPVNTTPGAQTLAEDSSKTFSLLNGNSIAVSDVDGDRLTTTLSVEHGVLTLGPLKGGVSFSGNGTGSITLVGSQAAINLALQGLKYVPGKDYNGQDTLTINTTDGKLSDSDSVTLNITPVNDAPVATPTTASTLEDAPVIGGKLAATDVDGDTLTYSAKGTLPGGFTLNSDGTWTLDPSHADYQHLAEGKSTTLTINFTATDGKLSGNSTLTITVTGVNDKPTITAATATAIEGNGEISGQIAASDVDDGAVLSFSTTANVAGLTLGTDGKWTFDANNSAYDYLKGGEELVITVPVTVTDEHGASADSTLTITLTGTNDAPVANAVSASGNEDQAARIQVNLSGSDVDGTITGFTIGSVPANGTLYAGANGGTALKAGDSVTGPVYFVPNKDWNGTTTFEYSAVDNDGATSVDKATATITIAPVNDRPVGVNDSVTLDEDTTATGNVLSNDKDVDGDTLTVTKFSITGLPFVSAKAGETLDLGVGKLTIKANGDFTFVPAKDYNGPVPSVTYTLSDGSLTSTATLRFDITPVNDAPVNTTPGAQTLNEDGSKVFSIFGSNSVSVSDVDGDRLTTTLTVEHGVLTLGPLLGGVTFSGNGTGSITLSGTQAAINAALQGLKYVPAANYNGQDTLTISTSDGKLSDTDSITLNITPVNDAPVATPTSDSTVEDAPAIGGKLAATDVDGDVLTFTLKNAAPAGFSLNADGSWTFDPSNAAYQALGEGEKLVIQIPFTATDGSLSSSSTLTITVTGVNDVPTVTGAITYGTNEDAAGHVIDLLANASDADAKDVLNAVNITETSGKDASGVTIQGNTLVVDPSKYNYLAKGESVVLTYEYQVSDGKGGLVTTSATVTIDGVNDAPVVSSAIVVDSNEDAAAFNVDLLANATDVDLSDVLGISNLKQVGTQDASGVTLSGNGLQVNPNAYNYLAAGEKLVLTYSYDVVDNNGGVTPTTATITIEGRNDAPVLESTVQSGSITERADGVPGENAGSLTASGDIGFSDADLSNTHTVGSQLISAKDGKGLDVDVLGNLSAAISDAAQGDGQGSVHWNYSVAAGALDYLGAGETVTLVYRVTVTDSSGASASRDVTITLTGSNDAPIVSGVATTLTNEDEAAYSLDLLQHASDEDANDILSVDNLQLVGGGNDAGVTFDAASNSLQIDPSQYNYLAAGEKVVLNYSYEVSDGKGGVVSANASVTIEGRNDAPVVTDTSVTVAEESVGTPLNIAAPTDVDSSDVLTITVTGLPTVGTVTLANGTPVSNGQTLTSAELQGLKYNGPDDYKAGDPVGNFTYSVNDGTTSVEGKVTLGVTPVNDAPDANDDFGVIAGLKGNYYGYREGVDGGNLQNLAGVAAFIASRTPSATFTATELNYGNGVSNNLGNDQQLQKFLGADAASLNIDPANTSDAIIEMNGQINLNAGTYQFRVTADDGYSILVDGKVVAEFNGNQSPTARESATFTITESGPHDIQIIYWDQGGQAQLKVELRPEGGSYTVVGGAQLSQAGNDLLITNEDQPLTIEPSTLLGNDSDVDGDTLSIVSVQDAVNGSVALVNGKVVFTPDANFNGKATFTYTISDGNGKFDTATVTVGVKPVNDAPVSAPQSLTTAEDTAVDGKITATDVDGDTLTYSIASGNAPQHGTVTLRADGTFTYVPGKDYNGQDSFTVTISDGKGGTTTSVISLDITPVNDLPVTADQTKVTDEDQSVSGQIVASDADGDKLSYVIQSGVAHGSILLNTVTGAYTYTPNKDYNGTDSFTIRVYDPKGGYADSVVNITINPVNDAPVSGPQSLTTDEDVAVSGKVNAIDVDGDALTYSIANGNGPQHGTVTLNADGTFNYVPNKDYNGQDRFTVTISDGKGGTTTSVISLDITPVNDLPVTADQTKVTDEDQSVSGQIAASDVDGDKLTYTIQSGVAHGSILLNTVTGAYTYTPNKDFNGTDSFTIRVYDPKGGYADSVVTVTVNPVNDAPVANDDSVTTLEDTAVTIDVLANDTDVDGDSLLISGASAGHGSVSVVDGKLVYTPTANYSGSDTISYSISDGKGGTSTASVQVTVTPVADAPNLSIQTPAGTPHATGLTLQSWNGLALGSSGNGATPATLKATIDAAGTPASSTSANDAHLDNVNAGVANKFSGLIYLQAGETYTFSGVGDDSVLVSVGGTTVASATWSGNTGQFSGSFTAQQSGYYTLDIYQHNQSGPGNLDVNVKVGNGPVQDLSTANVLLYRDTTDLTGDGVRVSELHGSDGKGYYQVYGYNEGDENSSIPLSHLSASLVDTDLSESLSTSISQIPSGVTISDGTPGHSFTADGTHSEVDISGWNLSNLSLTSPNAGSFDLKVTATATEGANGDKASTSLTLPVVVHGVNDAPTSADNTVNTNEDTPHSFSSADFVFNDVDAGDSLKAIRINSLPASGNLSLGNEAVTIGMIITAAQIASLVYTPAANASGNSSFSFSVQDQSGAFSTTPNTMTIQVAAVDDAPGLSNSTVSFAENIASGSTIADLNDRFTGTDQDRDGEPLFYSITGGNDAGLFAINSSTGVITLASGKSLDYETATQHQLQVTATDGKTPVNATVTVNVTNVNDNGVVISDANPAANTVVENAANGATVGLTVLGRDGDVGATITKYELTDNAGGRFAINASTGVVTVADGSKLDYESATSHNITVKVTSSDGSTNTQVFTINLSNVNDNGITLTDANTAINSVAENATNDTPVGITALGVDGDAGTTVTYSLTNNAGGRFAIDAATGVVTVADGSKLDYENATSHSITVLATSSDGSTQSANYSIAVTNVNEAPVVVAGAAVTGNEDSSYIFKWSDFKVSDVDANSSLSIKIESLPGEGKLQVKSGNNWVDVNTNATVTKSVIDGGGLRFVPDSNESGHDSFGGNGIGLNQATYATFNYSGSDGSLSTASSTMGIDITPVADVPTLSVKSAAKSTLFTTTWESAPDSDYTSESIKGSTFENWTLVTTGDKRTGGTNVFEVWGHNDNMENQAGNLVTIKMPGTGNNDALELNDAGGTMAQTLGITRNVATEVGKVYDLSMDYAGRLGFDTTYTKIAVYLGSTLVGEYGSSSSQTSLNWENIHFSFVGTGSTEALTIKLAGTSTHESGRGALIDNITLSSSQGVVAGDGGVNGKTSIALANYISGALTDTDGSESLRYDLSSLPAGASIVVGNSTLAAVNGVVSLSAAQLATAKLQVSGAVRGEIGLDVKAVSVEPNGSTESTNSQHLTLKIVEGGVSHDSLTTNTITVADTSSALSSGLTGEYWGYQEGTNGPNLTSLSQVEAFIESRTGNTSSLVGSNDNAAASSVNATFIANQINYGLRNNGNTVFSDDLGDNRTVTNGNTIGSSGDSQNNLYDFLTAAGTGNVSSLKAGGANLGDTSDAIIRAHGFLSVNAGTYDIRITADDGYRLMIGGQDIANVDKIQSTTTDTYKGVSIAGGLQALELLYWDQGGAASLKVEFKLSGSADNTYKVLGSNGINLYQAPGEGQELVQTNTGWAIHTIGTTNGGDASDLINGSKYSDILNGGNGHDVLYGNGGHDLLNGGDGNDLLIGGVGNDTLIGGAGADTFMWKSGDFGNDVIKDFNAAEGDRIDISELLPDTANANNLLDYLKVDTVTNTLQVSTTGDLANNVDVTIKLEGVNLSQYGATSSQIVNSLVAGADPLVKTEHH